MIGREREKPHNDGFQNLMPVIMYLISKVTKTYQVGE